MAVTSVEYENGRKRRGVWPFILGLLLGLLIGALGAYTVANNDSDTTNSDQSKSSRTTKQNEKSDDGTLNSEQRADVARYASLLVESSREGVDVPSDEAAAAKDALSDATKGLVSALDEAKLLKNSADTDELIGLVEAVNTSFLEYAATAREGDNHEAVDTAMNELQNYLEQNANFADTSKVDAMFTSFKNTVLESVRDFVDADYKSSYDKQSQAQTELQAVVDNLKVQ